MCGVRLGEIEVLHRGRFLELVRRGVGQDAEWEFVRRRGIHGVAVMLAITPDDEILLVRQFRPPVEADVWELPAGLADRPQEGLLECAQRELIEETGFRAGKMELLIRGPAAAASSSTLLDIYLATELEPVTSGPTGDEFLPLHVRRIPRGQVVRWLEERVERGEMVDPRIFGALLLAERRLGGRRREPGDE